MGSIEGLLKQRALFDRFVHKHGRLPTEVDPDYLEMLRMSKYRTVDVPDVSPGKCGNCGASKNDGRRYIDIGLHIDWYGALFLCGECLQDITREMGLFEKLEAQLEEAQVTQETLVKLQEKGEEIHETVLQTAKEIEQFYDRVHSYGMGSDSISTPSVGINETESDRAGTNKAKSRITKPPTSSRSKDVPSLADLLDKTGQ